MSYLYTLYFSCQAIVEVACDILFLISTVFIMIFSMYMYNIYVCTVHEAK